MGHLKVIVDFDGTLTAEEAQVADLAAKSLDTLANEILHVPREVLADDYQATQERLLRAPHRHFWEVNGLVASYCDEGAFILNTTTLQTMLRENRAYAEAIATAYPQAEYDPVVDCTNDLFHRHTAELPPQFRPAARDLLVALSQDPQRTPVVLTNSLGDKVRRHLNTLGLADEVAVLGDTRQYEMMPDWPHLFSHPELGEIRVWPVDDLHTVDLRRPAYHRALVRAAADGAHLAEMADGAHLAVVADTFSLPGAMPMIMDIPFYLLRTAYTPKWCIDAVSRHPSGQVLGDLADLPAMLDRL